MQKYKKSASHLTSFLKFIPGELKIFGLPLFVNSFNFSSTQLKDLFEALQSFISTTRILPTFIPLL